LMAHCMFMCTYALDMTLDTCFLYSDLSIQVYLHDFGFTTDSMITIFITGHCMYLRVEPHHFDHVHV